MQNEKKINVVTVYFQIAFEKKMVYFQLSV